MSVTPELLSDHLELNPLAGMFESFSLATLHRTYSLPGLRPVRVLITHGAPGQPWSAQLDVLGPDMEWKHVSFNRALPHQADNGEAEADRLATLASRLQVEASR